MDYKGIQVKIDNFEKREDVYLVGLEGVLDTLTVEEADNKINSLLDKDKICLLLDCRSLRYVNSMGLAIILRYHIHLHRRGGALKLISPNKTLRGIIEVSGAIKLLNLYETESQAFQAWLAEPHEIKNV